MNLVLFLLVWLFGLLGVHTITRLWQATTMPVVCMLLVRWLGWRRGDDDLWGSIDIHASRAIWVVWCATVLYPRAPVVAHIMECIGCMTVYISVGVSSFLMMCTWFYGAVCTNWGLMCTASISVLWLLVGPMTWVGLVLSKKS